MIVGDTMQAAEYRHYFFGGKSRGEDTTEVAQLPKIDAAWCGPELTAAKWDFENHTVTANYERKPFDGNRHERRKAAAIDRAWEKRMQKEAKS